MEKEGIRMDTDFPKSLSHDLDNDIKRHEAAIYEVEKILI
jgi:DNA polymerase-1